MTNDELPDTQNKKDTRNIIINQAGIKDISHPMTFIDKFNQVQHTIGLFTMTVELPPQVKGTHMSRFIEILNTKDVRFSVNSFTDLLTQISTNLGVPNAQLSVDFSFFRKKSAPSSKIESLLDYQVNLSSVLANELVQSRIKVMTPVTSLCPCSKSISKYGAHNQRSLITIDAMLSHQDELFVEDLIGVAEKSASSELYAILKRDDEKFVTEQAYENPAFVEDLVRDMAMQLDQYASIASYILESENFESIHNHSAYARIER